MKLCAYIGLDEALGVDFLINRVSKHDVTVTDRRGNPVTLEINPVAAISRRSGTPTAVCGAST